MKKRKQHYIWRYYLNAWATDEQIFCLRENKIFKTNLMNIGNIRDFYRLKELSNQDIKFTYIKSLGSEFNFVMQKSPVRDCRVCQNFVFAKF
jgi:hypothetical protein